MMLTPRPPHAHIYDGPNVIWETDPSRMADDMFVKSFIAAHKAGNFRENLQAELIASRPLLDAISNQVNNDRAAKRMSKTRRPVDMSELYAINSHYTRTIPTHKICVVPKSFLASGILEKNDIYDTKENVEETFGGYTRDFSFFVSRIKDSDGKDYAISSNFNVMDDAIFDTLKRYGFKHILDEYANMFSGVIHDHLHGSTGTTFIHSGKKDPLHIADSPALAEWGLSKPLHKYKEPGALRKWSRSFKKDISDYNGYEHWVNRMFVRSRGSMLDDADIKRLLDHAEHYVAEVGKLKTKIEQCEGKEKADNIAEFLVCAYVSYLQAHVPLEDDKYAGLDKAIKALHLNPVTPKINLLAGFIGHEVRLPIADHFLQVVSELVRAKHYTVDNSNLKYIIPVLQKGGFMASARISCDDDIPGILDAITLKDLLEAINQKRLSLDEVGQLYAASNEMVQEYVQTRYEENNDGGLTYTQEPGTDTFWERLTHIVLEDGGIDDSRILGIADAMQKMGMKRGQPAPSLTGLGAIRYKCMMQDNGFTEAIHQPRPLIFDSCFKKRVKHATDMQITRLYADAMDEEIDARHIKKSIVEAARTDLKTARQYRQTHNAVHPFEVRAFSGAAR